MGFREYAKHKGITETYLKDLINRGKLHGALSQNKHGGKIIFCETADKLINDLKEPEPVDQKTQVKQREAGLNNARTAKTAIEAKLANLKYEQAAKKLVRIDKVIEAANSMGKLTRETLLTLPDRLAPILAGETKIEIVHKVLMEEINSALRNLALSNFDFFKDETDESE